MFRTFAFRLLRMIFKVPGLHSAFTLLIQLIWDPRRKNRLLTLSEILENSPKPASCPSIMLVNVTGLCNLRCSFCEIHYFYHHAQQVGGKVHSNFMDLRTIQAWDPWLRYVRNFAFETGVGEPFVNPHITDIITYLRQNYPRMSLSVTTNGLLLGSKIRQMLVDQRFNDISISLHAGTPNVYNSLQGSGYSKVVENIRELILLRAQQNSPYPVVGINFALNKLNASSLEALIYLAKELSVDQIYLYHYYHARNSLQTDISFLANPEKGNEYIRKAYSLAKRLGVRILPDSPSYLLMQQQTDLLDDGKQCYLPWTNIQFPPCPEEKDCHYVGVCNRINLFKVDLNGWEAQLDFRSIWHHPLLQYLRKTVNSRERNPICRFCRDPNTPYIRCMNTAEYARQRDKAIRGFFAAARREFPSIPEWYGLSVLDSNPYEYDDKDWPLL